MNGLIRQYIPKKYDLASVSDVDVGLIMNRLNHIVPENALISCLLLRYLFDQSVALTS